MNYSSLNLVSSTNRQTQVLNWCLNVVTICKTEKTLIATQAAARNHACVRSTRYRIRITFPCERATKTLPEMQTTDLQKRAELWPSRWASGSVLPRKRQRATEIRDWPWRRHRILFSQSSLLTKEIVVRAVCIVPRGVQHWNELSPRVRRPGDTEHPREIHVQVEMSILLASKKWSNFLIIESTF
jgi:hypothetical protein